MGKKKIKVLKVAFNDLGNGGIQSIIMVITEKLKNDIDTDIVVFNSKPAYYDQKFLEYGTIFRRPNYEGISSFRKKIDYFIRYFRIKRKIFQVINDHGPFDVVHSHSFFEAAPCLAAARKAKVPIRVAHSHNTAMKDKSKIPFRQIKELYRRLYRKIIRKNATHMVGCSRAAADYLFGPGEGFVINNCVNIDHFNRDRFVQEPHSSLKFIHVGKFSIQKNQLFIIDVLSELVKKRKDVYLTLIGSGDDYLVKVKEKIQKLGLDEHVTIKPHDSDVAKEMAVSDYFLFPSNFEGFGNVMLEAQAIGIHCFASTEVTKEVDCGLCTYIELSKGAEYWAEYILDFSEKHGAEKRPADMSRFSEDIFAKKFLDIYQGKM